MAAQSPEPKAPESHDPEVPHPEANHPTMSEHPPRDATRLLTDLVKEHHVTMFRYAYWLTGSSPDAEDLLQKTFLIAHQKMDQVRDPSATRSWLFTVLRNCFLKSKRRRLPLSFAEFDFDANGIIETKPVLDELDEEELFAAIHALPDPYKLVTLMFYFEDLSYKQIAEQLEIPTGTVMSRLSRAKAHLRRALSPDNEPSPPGNAVPHENLQPTTGNSN